MNISEPKNYIRLLPDTPTNCKDLLSKYKIKVMYNNSVTCIFKKNYSTSGIMPGKNICYIMPEHGDMYCPCHQCCVYRFTKEWENEGFTLENIVEK